MAGWKLRKDKTQAETPADQAEAADTLTAAHGAQVYAPPPPETEVPEKAAETTNTIHAGPILDLGSAPVVSATSGAAQPVSLTPDFEMENYLRFEEDEEPLTLVDYSATAQENADPLPPSSTVTLSPSFDTPTAAPDAPTDFTSTLRMSREDLAGALAPTTPGGIPAVPPFVLDTPLVSPSTEQMAPRLVVRMGRLSAAFDLTKDVTVIGRPDSEMHYYPDVEIDLDDAVSRRHAEVLKHEDEYYLLDSGSTNGTLLNGEKLTPHEERKLAHGDRIRVGERTEIIFE